VPEGWDVSRLKFSVDRISKGTTPSTIGKTIENEGTVRFIKAENISNNAVSLEPQFFIDSETDMLLSRSSLRESDILFVIAGATIGKCAILERTLLPANTNQAVAFIRPNRRANPSYLHYCLQSDFIQKVLWLVAVQSAQPNLSMEDLGNFILLLPPPAIQSDIVQYLDNSLESLEKVVDKVSHSIKLLVKYRSALISAAVTGKIDVRKEVTVD
jgi:type I restriction enzyme, S subunit